MSKRDNPLLLQDIRSSISKIFDYTKDFTFDSFTDHFMVQDAVVRNFTIIGEAISRLPENFKQQYPRIEWQVIKDFRNRIVHDYFGIDLEIVWDIIQTYLTRVKIKD